LSCEKNPVAKSKEVKTGYKLAESSKVGHGSKMALLMMMMMIVVFYCQHAIKNG
jgi:hypothetical protein